MSHSAKDRKLFESETSSSSLITRRQINSRASRIDFDEWLFGRLAPKSGEAILDVGCGTGAQSLHFLNAVGPTGLVCATDISKESVEKLRSDAQGARQLETCVEDMVFLESKIIPSFSKKQFDLVQSSYALYYANDHHAVLNAMKNLMKTDGRMAVFSPSFPHSMVDFVRKHIPIPPTVDESLIFGPKVLEPFFRNNFWEVQVHFFQNTLTFKTVGEFREFYRATTYYVESVETAVLDDVKQELDRHHKLVFQKCGYLIIGRDKR